MWNASGFYVNRLLLTKVYFQAVHPFSFIEMEGISQAGDRMTFLMTYFGFHGKLADCPKHGS